MRANGFDRPLYILPFDHRGSFQTKLFGWKGALTAEQTAEIAAPRQVIYDGCKVAVHDSVPEQKASILTEEQIGSAILRDAATHHYTTACCVEKSRQEEFDLEYGEDFARHIEAFRPTFSKVLVCYNAEGSRALNARQAGRLKRLSDYLHPATPAAMLEQILRDVDQMLVITVDPGFSHQHFLHSTPARISRVRQMLDRVKPDCDLEVDGGIDSKTARLCVEAGAGVQAAGSSVFGTNKSVPEAISCLRAGEE